MELFSIKIRCTFQLVSTTIDIIIKMKEDNIPVGKIAYYTGIPQDIIISI